MPPSTDSSASSSNPSEPITPPFNRNATWTATRPPAASTPDKESTPAPTTRLSLRKRFASFTRFAGKSASGALSAGSTPLSTTPLEECNQSIEKLDLSKGAAGGDTTPKVAIHAPSAPVSRRASFSKSDKDVFGQPHRPTAEEVGDDSPLQKVLKSPNAKPLPGHPGNLTSDQAKALHELTLALKQDGVLHDEPPSYQDTQLL